MRVLLVDDSDPIERYVRAAIEKEGWTVDRAANGGEALVKAKATPPDTILLDFVLPDVDGIDVLRQLFAAGVRAPTIVLSGAQNPEIMRRFAEAGAVDYLSKDDLTAARLRTALRMALDMHVADAPSKPRPQRGAPEGPEPAVRLRSKAGTVLVVDDTATFRALVRASLAAAGWNVVEAEDGEAALRTLDSSRPDVILLDHVLPDTDGAELLQMIRAEADAPPIIALTGHGDEGTAEKLLRAGAIDYLSKDELTTPRLLFTLERALWVGRARVDVTRKPRP